MNYYLDCFLSLSRKIYRLITRKNSFIYQNPQAIQGQQGNDVIFNTLSKNEPCFIGRFGSIELDTICTYLSIYADKNHIVKKVFEYITYKTKHPFYWSRGIRRSICNNAGFFPEKIVCGAPSKRGILMLDRLAKLYLECIPHLDVLVSWCKNESMIMNKIPNAKIIGLYSLESYHFKNPWTRALKGKKVLVVHPLANTIEMQYQKREKLFKNPDVLPEFDLQTIKAVNSAAGNNVLEYKDWFEALDGMKKQISEKDFDIALLGCGAYAFPLAKYIKDLGKKSVTLCGSLQVLFGIKGKRYDNDYGPRFYNEHWVYPSPSDRPLNYKKIEGGCYW